MIMVQKPIHLLSSPTSHRRHPSAPPAVVVQSTRTPGLLSLSKPSQPALPRPHHRQQQQRIQRPAPKVELPNSTTRSPAPIHAQTQPIEGPKRALPRKESTTFKADGSHLPPSAPERRGRQNTKPVKEKISQRSASHSSIRTHVHRHPHHQGSPPLPSQMHSQSEVLSSKSNANTRSSSALSRSRNPNTNSFDPFVVSSDSDSEASRTAGSDTAPKPQLVRAPKLAPRPSGKLARRRLPHSEVPGTPTPPSSRALPVPRGKNQSRTHTTGAMNLSRSDPVLSSMPARPILKRSAASNVAWDAFPVCDDLTDAEDDAPSTPVREKGHMATTWQQSLVFDDAPRTAPLTSTLAGYPFSQRSPSTPTPDRKRLHQRSPSEGVFNMSMDDDSSSDAADELKALVGLLPNKRISSAGSTPNGSGKSTKKDERHGFFASSNFQNSPSPDDLPPPAFGLKF